MSHHKPQLITGNLAFSLKKILLVSGDISYYVRLPRTQRDYIHGDRVRARITRKGDGSQLAEVEIISLVGRSRETLLAKVIAKNGKRYLSVLKEFGFYETTHVRFPPETTEDDIFVIRFTPDGAPMIVSKFSESGDFDYEERLLFFVSGTRMDFSLAVEADAEDIQSGKSQTIEHISSARRDFRDRFVFTIDGADAKDLDDAISIEQDPSGNYILGVHIADVAEYIREDGQLDREAYTRATSVYTPGKVIPMLPEAISNDVCSLHPGEPKLVLSCLMTIDPHGNVIKTEIVEGIIESAHRGVYEEIQKSHEGKNEVNQTLSSALDLAYTLYDILTERRKKEGKILFESSETVFEFASKTPSSGSSSGKLIPINVKNRSRVAAHMLIEEFMVIANEEVARWCDTHGLPFLSRVHGIPPFNSVDVIRKIIGKGKYPTHGRNGTIKGKDKSLEPKEIRDFLDALAPDDVYRYSRLLLPKMSKAVYADRKHRHFGLALEYYAHFTSPIRRYPDLQVHRIIKEKLHGTLTEGRIIHYQKILKKVARHCSERERASEDIERAFDSLYALRYMADKVGQTFSGRVAGIAEFAYFVELESGIEVTVYLPRERRYIIDPMEGILSTVQGKRIVQIGEKLKIEITGVMNDERRIVGELV